MKRPAIFLDRDGVLNECWVDDEGVSHPPASVAELVVIPGVPEACRRLRDGRFALVMVTNQPDVARGIQRRETVEAMNDALVRRLNLDAAMTCFHDANDGCGCRKPKPGMLLRAAEELELDLTASYMIGDRLTDVAAGKAAGCRTVLLAKVAIDESDIVAADLGAAVDRILVEA